MNTKYKLYLDMDGVVSDMDARMSEITKGASKSPDYPTGKFWSNVTHYDRNVAPFYETLPKMPGADKLVQFAQDNFEFVSFLTATGTTPKDVVEQKRRWVAQHYPDMKVITVTTSPEKAVYASPNSILVDDREKSISPWRRAGGIGILYYDVNQVLGELKSFLK